MKMYCGLVNALVLLSISSNVNSCDRQEVQLQVTNSRSKTLQLCVNETLGETITVKTTAGGFIIHVQGTNCSTSQVLLNTSAGVDRVFISTTQITTLQQCSEKTDLQGHNLTFIIHGVDDANTGNLIAESGNNSLPDATSSSSTTSTTSTSVSILPSSTSQQPTTNNTAATSTTTAVSTTTALSTSTTSFGIAEAMPSKVLTVFALFVFTFLLCQSAS